MKRFIGKLALFSLILILLQVIVSTLYPPDLPAEITQLDDYLSAGVDIIYLGDSTLFYPLDEITIGEILQARLPDWTIGEIAHPAYQLDLYQRYIDYISRSDRPPEMVIIPVNMRSFSPEWDLRPTYQFEREKAVLTLGPSLASVLYKPLDTMGGFDPAISRETFLETPVYQGETAVGTVADFETLLGNNDTSDQGVEFAYYDQIPSEDDVEALEGTLIYYYMYDLDPAHRKIRALQESIDQLRANDIEPIVYITPINYQMGQRYIGEAFEAQVAENTQVIEQALADSGVEVINLVFGLDAFTFVDTEHLQEAGKRYVAEQLAQAIDPTPPSPPPTEPSPAVVAADPPEASPTVLALVPTVTPAPTVRPTNSPTNTRPTPSPTVNATPGITQLARPISPTRTATALIAVTEEPTAAAPSLPTATTLAPTDTPPTASLRQNLFAPLPEGATFGQLVSLEFISTYTPTGRYKVDQYRLRLTTADESGQAAEIRADLYIPQLDRRAELPVFVYGAGTTGLGSRCAPLDEPSSRNWGRYDWHMLGYAAQGYIGILPNWLWFDGPNRTPSYFIAELEGRVMLDAARAVYNFFENEAAQRIVARPQQAVFFGGYSSGGHAAFAAKDLAARYAPDVPAKGIISHGATTNPDVLLQENTIFSPYIIYTYREFYGNDVISPERVFLSGWLPNFEADVKTKCVDEVFAYYAFSAQEMYRSQFSNALYSQQLGSVFPAFKAALDENSSGLSPDGADIPALFLQGTADTVITPPSQARFAAELCRLGNSVTYNVYPAVDHPSIRRESFSDTLAWMENIATGGLPKNDCGALIGQ